MNESQRHDCMMVHRVVEKAAGRDLWVIAEDWPTHDDAWRAARLALFWLGSKRVRIWDDQIDEIIELLGIDRDRPFGMNLTCTEKEPAQNYTEMS